MLSPEERSLNSPYQNLPPERFWRRGVAEQHPTSIKGLYRKKFSISPSTPIATAGSCFAQHIGGRLKAAGYNVMDVEPAPEALSDAAARKYGWRIYSARYGNVYLAAQLLQLAQEAYGLLEPADAVWEKDGRFYDALRPSVEPEGLSCPEEVRAHRAEHLAAVRGMLERMGLMIFTFGLTEGWRHARSGTVYPTAPGTIAGSYDETVHEFHNYRTGEIRDHFLAFRDLVRKRNPNVRFLLTVSPVPLTATAADHHVLVATTYSKSVLRAVTGELSELPDIDYFPSYELIASPFSRAAFYSPNLRSVEEAGVDAVMRVFFDQHRPYRKAAKAEGSKPPTPEDLVCEEVMLEHFGK